MLLNGAHTVSTQSATSPSQLEKRAMGEIHSYNLQFSTYTKFSAKLFLTLDMYTYVCISLFKKC